jgi:hypothetical protein
MKIKGKERIFEMVKIESLSGWPELGTSLFTLEGGHFERLLSRFSSGFSLET